MMKNDGRGMTPQDQRELARRLGRTPQWLRTIGIKPRSSMAAIFLCLSLYRDRLREKASELDAHSNDVQSEILRLHEGITGIEFEVVDNEQP